MINPRPDASKLATEINTSLNLADELLTLAGGDTQSVIKASNQSGSLAEVKARILDNRFSKLERKSTNGNEEEQCSQL